MRNFWEHKIPTLLGLLLIVIGVGATTYLVGTGARIFNFAAPSENPQNIRITNVTDTGFSITYKTDASVTGTISIGKNTNNLQAIFDDRDQKSGIPKMYFLHSITIKDLTPKTQYIFSITSGATTYLDNGAYFTAQTGPALTTAPTQIAPISGMLIVPTGSAPNEALVYVTVANGQTLSALTDSGGKYSIPLSTMRITDFSQAIDLTPTAILQVLAMDSTNSSHAQILLSSAGTVPTITLSQNYDFTTTSTPLASQSALITGFPVFGLNTTVNPQPQIITPSKNESFTDQKPQFQGTASPNSTVGVEIHSDAAITTSIKTDSSGTWTYRPPTNLSPGSHTITITAPGPNGILQSITQSFTVYAAGTQVNQPATPSGTLTPTSTPVSNAVSPTITPTTAAAQNALISPTPTKTITSLLPTGSNTVVFGALAGIATAAVGMVLFLLTRGASL